jgi:hypothetical protein
VLRDQHLDTAAFRCLAIADGDVISPIHGDEASLLEMHQRPVQGLIFIDDACHPAGRVTRCRIQSAGIWT